VPFAAPQGDRFDVTLLKPVLASVDPLIVQTGSSAAFVLRGSNLQGATKVNITPPDGVAVGTVSVNTSGDIANVAVAVSASAVPGPRVVSIVTAAGESATVAGPTNTVTLSATAGTTYSSVLSKAVGVVLADSAPPPTAARSVYALPVGVVIPLPPPPASSIGLYSKPVGVALGAVALGLEPLGFNVGEVGRVVVRGMGLPASTTLLLEPAAGITLNGVPAVAADGRSVTQSITIAADAAQGARGVQLSVGGAPILLAPGVDLGFTIGPGSPSIVSLATILARQGETLNLVIRGANLRDVVEVLAEPAGGVLFGQSPTVAADGTQLRVGVFVAADAALGSRVIRVRTRSGISSSVAAPANTFTVFPP
jgi:hypothetical protein